MWLFAPHRIEQRKVPRYNKVATQDTIEEHNTDHQERKAFLVDAIADRAGDSLLSMSKENLLPAQRDLSAANSTPHTCNKNSCSLPCGRKPECLLP